MADELRTATLDLVMFRTDAFVMPLLGAKGAILTDDTFGLWDGVTVDATLITVTFDVGAAGGTVSATSGWTTETFDGGITSAVISILVFSPLLTSVSCQQYQ